MPKLSWDRPNELQYEAGLDRGVLYPPEISGVPWNGLLSVNESIEESDSTPLYFDAVKRYDLVKPGDFSASLSAFTYPDEFLEFDGFSDGLGGIFLDNQPRKTFDLSYRTSLGDSVNELDRGYKIHLLYNLTAEPAGTARRTLGGSISPNSFSWTLKAVPVSVSGYRPTAHIVIDSTKIYPDKLQTIEDILYGTESEMARMITPDELEDLRIVTITITDLGDGTWTISGPDEYIYPVEGDAFELYVTGIKYLDSESYAISSS